MSKHQLDGRADGVLLRGSGGWCSGGVSGHGDLHGRYHLHPNLAHPGIGCFFEPKPGSFTDIEEFKLRIVILLAVPGSENRWVAEGIARYSSRERPAGSEHGVRLPPDRPPRRG